MAHCAGCAFDWTVDYVGERTAFGQTIASFQNTRFELAEMKTELDIAWVFVDRQIEALKRRRAHRHRCPPRPSGG